jgi:Uma2 family endonuclease
MITAPRKARFTPDDLLMMEGDERFELVDGHLVSTDMSGLAAAIASRLVLRLAALVESQNLGLVMTSDASYRCFAEDVERVRRPDVSFIERSRLRPELLIGHIPIAPDLAVEVVSPGDLFVDVRRKVGEYLRAGVRLVWVINPDEAEVQVFRVGGTYSLVRSGEFLDGESVVPGLSIPLAELFAIPALDIPQ